LEKIEKKSLLASGTIICGILLSGFPAYIISLLNSPVSREGVFLILWLMFSIPFGLVFYIFLLKWYQEKENKFQY
jgi:hypothetical protein